MRQFGTELQGTLAKYMLRIAQADDDTAEDLEMFRKLRGIVLAAREELMQIYTRMEETKNKIVMGKLKARLLCGVTRKISSKK